MASFILYLTLSASYYVNLSPDVFPTPTIIQQSDKHDPKSAASFKTSVVHHAGGSAVDAKGFFANVTNGAPHFKAFGPLGGDPCGRRVRTSVTARGHQCRWAVNGGPFNMKTGNCDAGVFISDSQVLGSGGWKVQFGVTGNGSWIIGQLSPELVYQANVTFSIPGFSWLVYQGVNVAGNGSALAPRTSIGTDKSGRLVLLEVDGCETYSGCHFPVGKSEHGMAELLIELGVWNAINLDGGGSSTTVENGTVINHPTDFDKWLIPRERAVTTIVCIT